MKRPRVRKLRQIFVEKGMLHLDPVTFYGLMSMATFILWTDRVTLSDGGEKMWQLLKLNKL